MNIRQQNIQLLIYKECKTITNLFVFTLMKTAVPAPEAASNPTAITA